MQLTRKTAPDSVMLSFQMQFQSHMPYPSPQPIRMSGQLASRQVLAVQLRATGAKGLCGPMRVLGRVEEVLQGSQGFQGSKVPSFEFAESPL